MADVALEHVTKVYPNGVRGVNDLTLQVGHGELVVLVGPSGCGKTTLLRLIAGLEEPTAGMIRIGGRSMNGVPPAERGVALVFERPASYPHLSVRENLGFGLRLPGRCPADEIDRRVTDVAALLGLENVLDRRPNALSGGQQQRVAVGRALVRRPEVILLDEPLSSLDGPLRAELRRELHLLQRRFGTTMIYVTHDQVEALSLADRLVVLRDGAIEQSGSPRRVYQEPRNRFVAGFLGWPAMNFVEGRIECDESGIRLAGLGSSIRLPDMAAKVMAPCRGQTLLLGVRPEDVGLTENPGDGPIVPGRLSIRTTVVLVEAFGFGVLVTCRQADWQMTALVPSASKMPVAGAEVGLDFALERAHWFDAQTGSALALWPPEQTSEVAEISGV
jgi:multiple sugar transport system ATP-binding protein